MCIRDSDETEFMYPSNYSDLYTHLKPGQKIVIGDGDVELLLKEIRDDKMICEVLLGSLIKPGKALNLPGADYTSAILTEKDIENLEHSINTGWDSVSVSFITDREAALEVKKQIGDRDMKLIAKIEDGEGVCNIDAILKVVDGVMIARGGLGVELGLEKIPMVQRLLIEKCNEAGKPVITATQMLESMTENPKPTRAEVSDVATSILLGSDSVMLSAESTTGKYPVEAVKFLTKVALEIEPNLKPTILRSKALDASSFADAITKAAAEMCINMEDEISKVIVVTKTGTTARILGRHSVKQPIYAFTSSDFYKRSLALCKGVYKAFTFEGIEKGSDDFDREKAMRIIFDLAKENGIVENGESVLFIGKASIDREDYFPNIFEIIKVE